MHMLLKWHVGLYAAKLEHKMLNYLTDFGELQKMHTFINTVITYATRRLS